MTEWIPAEFVEHIRNLTKMCHDRRRTHYISSHPAVISEGMDKGFTSGAQVPGARAERRAHGGRPAAGRTAPGGARRAAEAACR
jgi:hypothetical protein